MKYQVSKETIEQVLGALHSHLFSEGGEYNNDDIIDATEKLEAEIAKQQVQADNSCEHSL